MSIVGSQTFLHPIGGSRFVHSLRRLWRVIEPKLLSLATRVALDSAQKCEVVDKNRRQRRVHEFGHHMMIMSELFLGLRI